MKKITCITLLCFSGLFTLQAQEEQNLLMNGGFENTDYNTFSYDNSSVTGCPDVISGWDLIEKPVKNDYNNVGLNMYNVRATMGKYNPVQDDNVQYIRIQRYEWNGWGDGGIQQTVDVVPSTTYSLSFLYRLSKKAAGTTIVPAWMLIQEDDKAPAKSLLYNEMDEGWYKKTKEFSTSATAKQVRIMLGVTGGKVNEWGGNIDLWADFDNVNLLQGEPVSSIEELSASKTRIKAYMNESELLLSGLVVGEPVVIYNVLGRAMNTFEASDETAVVSLPERGVYIVKNGSQRTPLKMIIK